MKRIFKGFLFLALAGLLAGAATMPLSAQVTIPQGSIIHSAVFSIYHYAFASGQTVNVHRITQDWSELGVTWNSFAGAFDPSVIGSFSTAVVGWKTVDLTALVQAWVSGMLPNYGVVLKQGLTPYSIYTSSEFVDPVLRPKLEISYTPPGGVSTQVTIQRPGAEQDGVADAYLWPFRPDTNFGNATPLYTGDLNGYEKISLVRFFINIPPPSPGTGTPGYWKNHPGAWPVEGITIGGVYYTKAEAIAMMNTAPSGDMTYVMFMALVAAELNVMIGNDSSCIADTITAAQNWMWQNPLGSGVAGRSTAWEIGEPLYEKLDAYNNGLLCAPSRDSFEY